MSRPPTSEPPLVRDEELVDLVDADDAVVEVVTRSEMRRRGTAARHRAVYVAVVTSAGELVVHQRAAWKDVYPGWWDVCFGGVLAAGEAWDDAARRELAEEAGIHAEPRLLGAGTWEAPGVSLMGRVYRVDHDGPFPCPDGEVVQLARVALTDLATWLAGRRVCPDSVDLVLPRLLGQVPSAGEPGQGG